jgi:hypothetical protein
MSQATHTNTRIPWAGILAQRQLQSLGEGLDRGACGKGEPGLDNLRELLEVTVERELDLEGHRKAYCS